MINQILEEEDWHNAMKISEKSPIVVYCYATWCQPCQIFKPKLMEFANQHPNVETYLVDVDELADILLDLGVMKVPMTLQIIKGEVVAQVHGSQIDEIIKFY